MGFERFTKTGRSFMPKVSIWSRGQIGFSVGAVSRYKVDQYDYVVFLYDADSKKVGFEFTNDEKEAGAAKLNKRNTGVIVGAKSFLDYYGIDYKETRQYTLEHDKENNLYVINLQEGDSTETDTGTKTETVE